MSDAEKAALARRHDPIATEQWGAGSSREEWSGYENVKYILNDMWAALEEQIWIHGDWPFTVTKHNVDSDNGLHHSTATAQLTFDAATAEAEAGETEGAAAAGYGSFGSRGSIVYDNVAPDYDTSAIPFD